MRVVDVMRANMTFKKGFTLVELLAVIVVLAVILAIAVPGISSLITNIKKSAFESNVKMLFKHFGYEKLANANFDITTITEQNITDYNLPNSNYKVMKISIVDDNPYAVIIGKNKWDGLTACGTSKSVNIVKTGNDEICEDIGIVMPFVAYDEVKGVNRPKLYGGMTPVIWADGSWQDTTSDNPDWYNYTTTDKKWANARTNDGSLWVWVPRFAYQMETGYHTNTAGTINIKFLKYNTNTATDDTTVSLVPEYSGSSQTNYIVHPAFINGDDPLTGIWVAKFEAGGTIGNIDILPNVASLRNQTIGSFFDAGYNMRYNTKYGWNMGKVDSHMMKNTEWSAISYLAKSIYGKNAEIYPNSSNTFITGCSGNASNASNYSGCQYAYSTVEGNQASTTGNIYGIYDMSGGANEYVSFYINNNNAVLATNGSSIINASDRYKNYFTPSSDTSANNYINDYVKYGHNMYETSSTDTGVTSWYTDYSVMPTAATPWISRGGPYNGGASSGIFAFQSSNGAISSSIGFRPTIPSIIDTTSPVVTLNGDNPVRLKLGRTYIDSGVNATDNSGTDPTIIIKSNINPSVKGTYKVTYIVRDSDGNSTSIDRTVIVDTIEIYTAQDFYNIRNNVTGDYTLMNDIDMSTSEYAANFTAIDNFSGTIDGQEYKISNLKVNTGGIFTNLRTGFEIVDLELNNFSKTKKIMDLHNNPKTYHPHFFYA
jgi:prepilin-type N-terminal cleavage/methylation domain-containing protein